MASMTTNGLVDRSSSVAGRRMLEVLLKETAELLEASAALLVTYDARTDAARSITPYGIPDNRLSKIVGIQTGTARKLAASTQPFVVDDLSSLGWPAANGEASLMLSAPIRWRGRVSAVLSILGWSPDEEQLEEDGHLLSLFAVLFGLILRNSELFADLGRLREEINDRLASARDEFALRTGSAADLLSAFIRAQEEERARIARDLHDGSSQLVAGTLYELQAIEECILQDRAHVALEKLKAAKATVRKIEAEHRRIIAGLNPPLLKTQGLGAAVDRLASDCDKAYHIECSVAVTGEPYRLAAEAESSAYRIIQEALNNAVSHAQASHIRVSIDYSRTRTQVAIEDDGIGFDPEGVLSSRPERMGLIGLRERARLIGADLNIRSSPGRGTLVLLNMPAGRAHDGAEDQRPGPAGDS